MGDGKTPASGRMLFSVRVLDDHFYFENICGMLKNTLPLMEVHDAFPVKTSEEIIKRCRLALSGVSYDEGFTADLGHGQYYLLTLIHCENSTSFFSVVPLSTKQCQSPEKPEFSHAMQNMAYFTELCDISQDGIFIWQVTPGNQFLLIYMNEAYTIQAGMARAELGKTLEETYVMPKAAYIRQFFEDCLETKQTVTYTNQYDTRILSVNLYPSFENGRVARIMGTCRDITSHVNETRQLENTNRELFLCDAMLRNQLQFEELISKTMREFMDTGYNGFSSCLSRFISQIGQLLKVSWAFILKNEGVLYGDSCQWLATDLSQDPHFFQTILQSDCSALMNQLQSGRLVIVNDLQKQKLGTFAPLLDSALKKQIRSLIIVPILHDGDLWGVLGIAQFDHKKMWTTMEVNMLKAAAETIMSAYLRIKVEKQFNESNRILVEYDESLQDMLAVQETIAAVSQKYTTTGINGFDTCTNDMLKNICELFGLDNASLFVTDDSGLTSTYEWCRNGISQRFRHESAMSSIASSWLDILSSYDYIAVNNSMDETLQLPSSLIDTLLVLGIKSFLVLPIRRGGEIRGAMAFGKVVGYHKWTNPQISTVKMFSDVFLGAYLRKHEEQQLALVNKTHMAFVRETVRQADVLLKIIRYSQAFVDATAENLLSVCMNIFKEVADVLQIESIRLSRYFEDYTKTCHLFDWSATGRLSGRTDKTNGQNDNICCVPLLYNKSVWGCMHFKCSEEEKKDEAAHLLELIAQYFVHAYMRIYPNTQDCLTTSQAKPEHKPLKLIPRPAAI